MPYPPNPDPAARPFPSLREFVPMMALTQALQAAAIDAMLPALGRIAGEFGVADANRRQLVVGLFLFASAIGSLVPGTLSDRFGRKPVLLSCIGGYLACALVSALSTSFEMMLASRVAMGLCSAGMIVLPSAIVRDRHEGDAMARLQSVMMMVFMFVPMAAPLVGQAVLAVAGWRWIFGLMVAMAVGLGGWIWLRLPETLDEAHRRPIAVGRVMRTTVATVTERGAVGYVLGVALIQGTLFGWVNSSQQLVAEHYGAGARFPLVFGAMALVMSTVSLVNAGIVERFGARRVSHSAVLAFIALSMAQLWVADHASQTLWHFMVPMTANLCLIGFIGANFSSISLQPFGREAGSAASSQTFVRMTISSTLGLLIGQAYDGTPRPLILAMCCAGAGALALVLFSERGRLFRRLHPPKR